MMGRDELMQYVEQLAREVHASRKAADPQHEREDRLTIGMVGYPNVGKSSVINVLLGASSLNHAAARVATGATPGKTKHFQTLQLPLREASSSGPGAAEPVPLTLCDCPGLVRPRCLRPRVIAET
jgi:large subunit GTPase 1